MQMELSVASTNTSPIRLYKAYDLKATGALAPLRPGSEIEIQPMALAHRDDRALTRYWIAPAQVSGIFVLLQTSFRARVGRHQPAKPAHPARQRE